MIATQSLPPPVVRFARAPGTGQQGSWAGDTPRVGLTAIPEGGKIEVAGGGVRILPFGSLHNLRTTGVGMLGVFTTDRPPDHKPGTADATKDEANADE